MMQPQWPGLGLTFDPTVSGAGLAPYGPPQAEGRPVCPASQPDAVARPWWTCGTSAVGPQNGAAGAGAPNAPGGSLAAAIANLIAQLQRLVGGYLGTVPGGTSGEQQFSTLDVSSTGDPHLAAVGTGAAGSGTVNDHFDSMTSHEDLVDSADVAGGYRVSTAVTQPDANGVTWNASAAVHANDGWDRVTMNRDGSYAIVDDGNPVELAPGRSMQLSGGETVTRNADGSLRVDAAGTNGGSISTTMRATGAGVDVTTHAQNIAAGGDAVNHGQPQPGQRHGHPHPRRAVAPPV